MISFWPTRTIECFGGAAYHKLEDEAIASILEIIIAGGLRNILDKTTDLGDNVYLLALAPLGKSAINSPHLMLHVTNQCTPDTGENTIKLCVVEYTERSGPSEGYRPPAKSLRPGEAGDLLDDFVGKIKQRLGFNQHELR